MWISDSFEQIDGVVFGSGWEISRQYAFEFKFTLPLAMPDPNNKVTIPTAPIAPPQNKPQPHPPIDDDPRNR
jgi:hypothetical protein